MTFFQINNSNAFNLQYHNQNHHHHHHQPVVTNSPSVALSNTNLKKLNNLVSNLGVGENDKLTSAPTNTTSISKFENNIKKFSFNSSFNQNNRNKFAYRNYLSKPNTTNTNTNSDNDFIFIKEENQDDIDEQKTQIKNSSIEIFSSLSSSSSSNSSSVSPTFSTSNCFDNGNYTESKSLVNSTITNSTKYFLNNSNYNSSVKSDASNLNTQQNNSNNSLFYNDMSKFEDLQQAGMILRKALKEIKILNLQDTQTNENSKISKSNSSSFNDLAFDNLTYFSSSEDLKESNLANNKHQSSNTTQINSEIIKKTLKSIKRKDKMKKNFFSHDQETENFLAGAKSMPDLSVINTNQVKNNQNAVNKTTKPDTNNTIQEEILDSNLEYEKRLRKMFRNKSLSRSLRRAKSVYYRNQRSKSLEDLSIEDRNNYLRDKANAAAQTLEFSSDSKKNSNLNLSSSNLRKSRLLLGRNIGSTLSFGSSCSSIASKMSDISSSYFHELSDWSPDFSSSEFESSEEELFHNIDWDANLSNIAFSGFNSSDEDDSDMDEYQKKSNTPKMNNTSVSKDSHQKCPIKETESSILDETKKLENNLLTEIKSQNFPGNSETINKMLNEIISRMLKLHPTLLSENMLNNPASIELINNLKPFQITTEILKEKKIKNNCTVCLGKLDLDDDVVKLSCEHFFHVDCIQLWLSKSATCPMCMTSFSQKIESFTNETRIFTKRETLL